MRYATVAVIGGGIVGQLVQHQIPEAEVYDWRDRKPTALTRNYGANYLWEPLPGFDCRTFQVLTHIDGAPATLPSVARYKDKIGKTGDVVGWERQFQEWQVGYEFERYPHANVRYGHRVVRIDRLKRVLYFANNVEPVEYEVLVSTIPLFSLLNLVGIPQPTGQFRFKPIYVMAMQRPPDAPHPTELMYVNYVSDPDILPYRITDRFGERHYESIHPYDRVATVKLTPGKIYPHPQTEEVLDVLRGYNVWTFGRYGSWQADELVNETWHRIAQWVEHAYGHQS